MNREMFLLGLALRQAMMQTEAQNNIKTVDKYDRRSEPHKPKMVSDLRSWLKLHMNMPIHIKVNYKYYPSGEIKQRVTYKPYALNEETLSKPTLPDYFSYSPDNDSSKPAYLLRADAVTHLLDKFIFKTVFSVKIKNIIVDIISRYKNVENNIHDFSRVINQQITLELKNQFPSYPSCNDEIIESFISYVGTKLHECG